MHDPNSVGQDRQYKTVDEAGKAMYGTYTENVSNVPTDQRLPQTQLPQAPDPSPFNIGPAIGPTGG